MQHRRTTVAIDPGRGHKGIVISFDPIGGYGFIKPAVGGQDVCILTADVESSLLSAVRPGQTVEYELSCNRAGTAIAVNIRLLRAAPRAFRTHPAKVMGRLLDFLP